MVPPLWENMGRTALARFRLHEEIGRAVRQKVPLGGGLNAVGITSEEMMPYGSTHDPGRKPSLAAIKDARRRSGRWQPFWIKRWNPRTPLSQPQVIAIKKALASGHPVACGLRWPKSQKGHQLLEVPPSNRVFDGHSIVFVGYEDKPKQMGGGVFLFRNSDGPHWGNKGYGTMSYAYARAYANDALWLQLRPLHSQAATEPSRLGVSTLGAGRHSLHSAAVSKDKASKPFHPWVGNHKKFTQSTPEKSRQVLLCKDRMAMAH
jgi:hypothetical protein